MQTSAHTSAQRPCSADFVAHGWSPAAAQELAAIQAEQQRTSPSNGAHAGFPDTVGIHARFEHGRNIRRLNHRSPLAEGEPPAGTIRITGRMCEEARVHATSGADPHALLSVRISTGAGPSFHATQDMGAGFDAHLAAHTKARLLQKGDEVTIVCAGIAGFQRINSPTVICSRVADVIPHRTACYAAA